AHSPGYQATPRGSRRCLSQSIRLQGPGARTCRGAPCLAEVQRRADQNGLLAGCCKPTCVAIAASKVGPKCSFTTCKLRFLADFFIALAASPTAFNSLLNVLYQAGGCTTR